MPEVDYEHTTTVKGYYGDDETENPEEETTPEKKANVVQKILESDKNLVTCVANEDRKTCIAGVWYELQKGQELVLPASAYKELKRCNVAHKKEV